ncbi:glycosyltransferase family 2 protein [Lapillicoccus sp.]|uniref:glycosyltransferase family 2 protein n=1 Tax=Lapillicoccus sp. TaxID=1909287 RepID=UPI0032677E9E
MVVTWQRRDLVLSCLDSLARQTTSHRVLVVDNASTDGSSEAVAVTFPEAKILRLPKNVGFAGGVAAAMSEVGTRFVALLNNDALAEPEWLEACLVAMQDPGVAAVTSKMLLVTTGSGVEARVVNNAGVVLLASLYGADRGLGEHDGSRYDVPVEVFGFSGGAVVLRTLAVKAAGGFADEWFMYYEDTDLSWRLRLAGWRIVYEPRAVVRHLHAASADPASEGFAFHNERNRLLMLLRDAPISAAVGATGRFVLTTASLAASRAARRSVPDAAVFRPMLRLRVLRDVAWRFPQTLRDRRHVPRSVSRRDVLREWTGATERPARVVS